MRRVAACRAVALAAVVGVWAGEARAWEMEAWPEFFRPGPFGKVTRADWRADTPPRPLGRDADGAVRLTAARNGYVSFHLAVGDAAGGAFTLAASCESRGIEIDLCREWFHRAAGDGAYYADALIPVAAGAELSLPDRQMRIPRQTAAAIFVDVWVPKSVRPGVHRGRIELTAGGQRIALPLRIEVLAAALPDDDVITADHNSYGDNWVSRYFPARAERVAKAGREWLGSDELFGSIHELHRLFYEHRGLLHQLGYGHTGRVNPNFAPELTGMGRTKRVKSWDRFDRHYGPLLDGSGLAGGRRGPRPVESVYLPINCNWPADYVGWGTPAYETEFVNVVARMEEHFRRKGWTNTSFEMCFTHKTRFKVFDWDGDETRFPKDNAYFKAFGRLLRKSVPADSPVRFVFRHDASWLMRQQFDDLAGVVNMWICNKVIFRFYPEAPALLRARGDKVWIYGSPPNAFGPAAGAVAMPLRAWMMRTHGFVHWLAISVDADPWFKFRGGATGMIFPGAKFGIDAPLASVRLKLQRNVLQDLALLERIGERIGADGVREKVAAFAGLKRTDWWSPDAKVKALPPWEWTNASIADEPSTYNRTRDRLDGRWWLAVRRFALGAGREVKP